MFDNNQPTHSNQFVITHELLSLLVWLIEHEETALTRIVQKACATGLKDTIRRNKKIDDVQLLEEAQQAIVDFFGILESHMLDALYEQSIKRAMEKNLLPTIDLIDTKTCDDSIVRTSIEKAANRLHDSPEAAKEVLYKELLKRWKPRKNQHAN